VTPAVARWLLAGTGALQLVMNVLTLVTGLPKIRQETAAGAVSERFGDLLSVAWSYSGIAGACMSVLLVLVAGPAADGNAAARRVAWAIGLYYVLLGPALYLAGLRRHAGLLVFCIFGLVVLAALRFGRP
jgi:hypothetical protein